MIWSKNSHGVDLGRGVKKKALFFQLLVFTQINLEGNICARLSGMGNKHGKITVPRAKKENTGFLTRREEKKPNYPTKRDHLLSGSFLSAKME